MLRTPIAPSTEVPTAPTSSLDAYSCVAAAGPTDLEPLINVIVLAFAADPVARWMYAHPERYLAYFGRLIRAFAGKAFSTGTAWRIDGNLGAALWLPPGVKPDEEAIVAILDESLPRDVLADVNAMFGEMAAYHPRDLHWYLPTIGVEPHLHRGGLGSALLAETLRRCDQEHLSAYLESSNPDNTALYQRFGFEALSFIGVEALHRNKGCGAALLQDGLRQCDREHRPAYLWSSNLQNTSLYQRHGFEIVATIQLGSSPPIFPMLRHAR